MVIGGGEQVAVEVWVPAEPVALLLVAAEAEVGVAHAGSVGLRGVLEKGKEA